MEYETFSLDDGKVKLYMSKEHRFGTDSLLLGEFARSTNNKHKTVVDLCSGCGIIPVLLGQGTPPQKIYAIEIQQEAADLIRQTVKENNLGFIEAVQGDLRDAGVLESIGRESVDLVTANPPYYPEKSGFERSSSSQKAARYEGECKLSEVVASAAYLLKFGGELKMCMTAPRLTECVGIMQAHSIEPKEIVLISAKQSATARLFLISGKKGAKPGVIVSWK